MAGDEAALVIHVVGQRAARAEEERGLIPAGVDLHIEALAGLLAVGDDGFQRVGIGDDALVVVEEVAVVGGQRIGVHHVAQRRGGYGAGVVLSGDQRLVVGSDLFQRAGGHQTGQLILREAVDIRAAFNVGDHGGGGVAFAHGLDGHGHVRVLSVRGLEGVDLRLGELNGGVGDPDLDFAVEAGGFGDGEGADRQQHGDGQKHGQEFLHIRHPPSNFCACAQTSV